MVVGISVTVDKSNAVFLHYVSSMIRYVTSQMFYNSIELSSHILLVPGNFSRGRGVIPSLAERGEQSCQRGYYQFGM
jgi:hypothetical protein